MNTRYTGILVILGAILAAAVFVSSNKGNEALRARHHQEFFGFDSGLVSLEIAFDDGQSAISLQNERNEWFVANPQGLPDRYPVDPATLEPVLAVLSTPLSGELRSINPAHHADFGLTAAQAVRVTPHGDGRGVLIGATGPDRRSTFLRFAESNDVYLVPQPIEFNFRQRRTPRDWRSTVVVQASLDAIARIDVAQQGQPPLRLRREGRDWRVEGAPAGFRADPSLVAGLVSNLNTVRASEFRDVPEGNEGLDSPLLALTLSDAVEGAPVRFVVGAAEDDNATRYFARGSANEGIVLVGAFFVERSLIGLLNQLRATLPESSAPAPAEDAADAAAAPEEEAPGEAAAPPDTAAAGEAAE